MKKSVRYVGLSGLVVLAGLSFLAAREAGRPQDVAAVDVDASIVPETRDLTGRTGAGPGQATGAEVPPQVPSVDVVEPAGGLGVVPGLTEVDGVLERQDEDFTIDGKEVDFGPIEWLVGAPAPKDLDGTGAPGSWWSELTGLAGTTVSVLGDVDDDDIDVFEIEGVALRPLYSAVAPWSDGWLGRDVDGAPAEKLKSGLSADEAVRLALENVPGVVISADVDVNDGHPFWEFDVRGKDGELYDVEIDAVTGKVIEIDRD